MPMVSVIIPSYNHEKYVGECIESVLQQTFQDFEIVITDDCSTDRTVEIIKNFKDPRIKLFVHAQNNGACIAANNCIEHSSGKYIAMLSSDDAWYPNKLAIQVQYLEDHPDVAAVFGRVDWIDENGNLIVAERFPYKNLFEADNRTRHEWLGLFFKVGNRLCHPSSLIRRDAYFDVGLLNPSFANLPDFDLWVRICLKYDIFILDEKLIRYRWLSDNSNASSDTQLTNFRIQFEHKQILNNYLRITAPEDLLAIFPEVSKYGNVMTETIPYFLGCLAIETGLDLKMAWGQETIYALLQNEQAAQILEENNNFTHLDFIKLTGKQDIYHREALQTLSRQAAERTQTTNRLSAQLAEKEKSLAERERELQKIRNSKAWKIALLLRRIHMILVPPGSRRARLLGTFVQVAITPFIRMMKNRRIKEELELIRASSLFDENWYLKNNPDVAEAKLDPLRHYLLYGGFEGRDPGPDFSSAWYLETYEDVKKARLNPLVHFLKHGVSEGRRASSDQIIQEPAARGFESER